MKNFFILILCIINLVFSDIATASVISITDTQKNKPSPTERTKSLDKLYEEIPDLNDTKALNKYLQERLAVTNIEKMSENEARSPNGISIVDPIELLKKKEKMLSAYQKIYNESMNKAGTMDEALNKDVKLEGVFYHQVENKAKPFVPDFPYVKVKLSNEKEILAPAEEHFPYVLTKIKIEPTGLLKVTEEFVFVSNNISFPYGFFRILPKFNQSRNGIKRRTDIDLQSVTINGKEYPYKVTEIGNYIHIEPQTNLNLPTGIYTYRFNYIIDRVVWHYDKFDELYWDITAKTLKNVVGSANAVVILPSDKKFMAQNAIVSTASKLDDKRVTINYLSPNSLAFADTQALDVGEDVHIFITLEKGTLLAPDFNKKYSWFIHDYGANIFILLTLIALIISYKISYHQLRCNKDKTNISLKRTPALFRYINQNTFDIRSFGAEILNLCSKNILTIQAKEDTAILIKKTDNLQKLAKHERKLLSILFPNTETTLIAGEESQLKLKRAYEFLQKHVTRTFNYVVFKLNIFYLMSGIIMLLVGEICSALISINPRHTFLIILSCSLLIFTNVLIYNLKFSRKYISALVKISAVSSIIALICWISIYTSLIYAVILTFCCLTIARYYQIFSRRNGLLRNKIKETEELKSSLQKNPEFTITSRDYFSKIPYIFAFNLENKYHTTEEFSLIQHFSHYTPDNKQ